MSAHVTSLEVLYFLTVMAVNENRFFVWVIAILSQNNRWKVEFLAFKGLLAESMHRSTAW